MVKRRERHTASATRPQRKRALSGPNPQSSLAVHFSEYFSSGRPGLRRLPPRVKAPSAPGSPCSMAL